MKLRGYQVEDVCRGEKTIDVTASNQDSDETVLLHIVTGSKLKSGGVSKEKVSGVEKIIEQHEADKLIVFGNRFTDAARKYLREQDIEFFSKKKKIISAFNLPELFVKIRDCVDALCQIKCGHIPKFVAECKGYSEQPIKCNYCDGSGKIQGMYQERGCPMCGGLQLKSHYSCPVRLLSDNADFHFERNWMILLQNDLSSLVDMLQSSKLKNEGNPDKEIEH